MLKWVKDGSKYLWPMKGGKVGLMNETDFYESTFRLWRISKTRFQFRRYDKKFLGLDNAKDGRFIVSVSQSPGRSETFKIFKQFPNSTRIRIKASNGLFLQVNNEGLLTADSRGDGGWKTDDPSVFEMIILRKLDGEFQVTNGYGPLAPKVMKEHWDTFITEDDFKFISSNGINTVRIPVGWWTARDPNPPAPYVGGSLKTLDKAFSWAEKYGLKVIIDLHAAPGSQSEATFSSSRDGFMEWGETEQSIKDTVAVIDFLTARYANHPSLYAVELLNEPQAPAISLDKLSDYYRAGYKAVRKHSSKAYVVLSNRMINGDEPADPSQLLPLSQDLEGSVIDLHHYHVFMPVFQNMSLDQNIQFLRGNLSAQLDHLMSPSGASVFVGEWATEWATGPSKEDYQKFAIAQLEVYDRASFGWAYWTLKSPPDHFSLEWMIKNGYIKL
ncbi:Glucan 1,3-beta-glucosidase, partial [Bertholletia excelsa]